MNKRRCEDCNIEIHKSSYRRHLRSEKHIRNEVKNYNRRIGKLAEEMSNPEYYVDRCYTSSGKKIDIDVDHLKQWFSKLDIGPNNHEM